MYKNLNQTSNKRNNPDQYRKELNHPLWKKRRLEIIKRDGDKCTKCGDTEKILNVHHKYYLFGKKPWEYPDDALITLCIDCHQLLHLGQYKKVIRSFSNEELGELLEEVKIYKETGSMKSLEKILYISEPTAFSLAQFFSRRHFLLSIEPIEDLKQTAFLGIIDAIKTFDLEKPPGLFPYWFMVHIRCTIYSTYIEKFKKYNGFDISSYFGKDSKQTFLFEIREDLLAVLKKLYIAKRLTYQDLYLIRRRYVDEMSVSDIYRVMSDYGSRYFLQKRLDRITEVVRKEFRKRGLVDF